MLLEIVGIFLMLSASFFPTATQLRGGLTAPLRAEEGRVVTPPDRCQDCLLNPASSGCPSCRLR